jgi:iron complex transport system permease protein
VQLSAFIFGLLAVALSYVAARKHKNISIVSLILSGVIVTGIFTALLTIIQFVSDPFKLQSIVHWTMGNLHNAGWDALQSAYIPILIGVIVLFLKRWRLNVLALGDEEARTSGIHPEREKIIVLIAATLASSAAVSVAGIIGLYGLIVPHMVRMMAGPDNRQTIPLNFLFGGTFLLVIDDFSRTMASFEIPIGVITMLIGAPIFLYLLKKTNIGWEN